MFQFIKAPGDYMGIDQKVTAQFDPKFAHLKAVITHGPSCLPAAVQLMDGDGHFYILPKELVGRETSSDDWVTPWTSSLCNEVRDLFYTSLKEVLGLIKYENDNGWATAKVQAGTAAGLAEMVLPNLMAAYAEKNARSEGKGDPYLKDWVEWAQTYTPAWLSQQVAAIARPVVAHANYNGIASASVCAMNRMALAMMAAVHKRFGPDWDGMVPIVERICGSPKAEPSACLINYMAACPEPGGPPLITRENIDKNLEVMTKAFALSKVPNRRYHVDAAVRMGNYVGLMADVKHQEGDIVGMDVLCIAACKFLHLSDVIIMQSDSSSIKFSRLWKNEVEKRIDSKSYFSSHYNLDRFVYDENATALQPYEDNASNSVDNKTLVGTISHHARYIAAVMSVVDRLSTLLDRNWVSLAERANKSKVPDFVFEGGEAKSGVIPHQEVFRFTEDLHATFSAKMYSLFQKSPLSDFGNLPVTLPPKCPPLFQGWLTLGTVLSRCMHAAEGQAFRVPSFMKACLLTSSTTVLELLSTIDEDLVTFKDKSIQAELGALRNIVKHALDKMKETG